jgi:hypothetical protein
METRSWKMGKLGLKSFIPWSGRATATPASGWWILKDLPETFLYSGTVVEEHELTRQDTLSITFKHPPGTDPSNAHYFILGNVPKVEQVKLHGIERRSDYYFQEREEEDGFYYSTTTNTLYVKLLHQKRSDTVVDYLFGLEL